MAATLNLKPVHHIRLTVTDVNKSRWFYTEVLGFDVAMDGPPAADHPHYEMAVENLQGGVVLATSGMLLGLRPADDSHRTSGDRFDPFRIGLDHVSFQVGDREELVTAAAVLDKHDVPHGEVTDLPVFGISVLALHDPDGIQLELAAPLAST